MSLDLYVYVDKLDSEVLTQVLSKLNSFDMECIIEPGFSLDTHNGFLPFCVEFRSHSNPKLLGCKFLTGFECYLEEFDFDKVVGSGGLDIDNIESPEILSKLKKSNWLIVFNWGVHNSLELRMAAMMSAIVTEELDGVCCYPADEIWYDTKTIVQESFEEVQAYENSLNSNDWKLHHFEGWKI